MAKQTYLHKRTNSSVYYFRCRIPKDLAFHFKDRREITFSLQTHDYHEATRMVSIEAGKWQAKFEQLRRSTTSAKTPVKRLDYSDAEIERLCLLWKHCVLETDDQQRLDGYEYETFEEQAERLIETEQDLKRIYARGELEKIYPALDGFLTLLRVAPPADEATYRQLCMSFLKTVLHTTKIQLARQNGEIIETESVAPSDKVYSEHVEQTKTTSSPQMDMDTLLENWRDAVAHRAPSTVESYTAAIREFKTWIKNISADKITRQNIIGFRDYLLKERLQSSKTAEKKIGILCSVLQLAVDDELLSANPAQRIKIPKPKNAPKPRIPYDKADLQSILNSPIYSNEQLTRGGKGEAAKWLPLLGMFTGARLEELAQLHVADIINDAEHGWYFNVTETVDDEDDSDNQTDSDQAKTLKTESSRRRIPVHPQLILAGFLRLVERCRNNGQQRLFPQLVPDSKGKYSGSWSRWWGRYARKVIGINSRRKVFHSFRHGFKDAAREADIAEDVSDALTGHSGGGVGRKYGNEHYPLAPLVRAIALIEYSGLKIPVVEPEISPDR